MNIQRALLTLVVCCLCTAPVSAQSTSAQSTRAQSTRSRPRAKPAMWAALQLTETQKTQVKNIHEKFAPAMKVAQKQAKDSSAKVYGREMTEVRGILTFSQQQTFDSYMNGQQRTRRGSVAKVVPARIAVPH